MTEENGVARARRALMLVGALLLAPAVSIAPVPVALPMAVAGVAAALVALCAPLPVLQRVPLPKRCGELALMALAGLGVVSVIMVIPLLFGEPDAGALWPVLLIAALTSATVALAFRANRLLGLCMASGLIAALMFAVHRVPAVLDVLVFEREGSSALFHGINPYAIDYPNPFPPRFDHLFFGPGIAADGLLHVGFPYPPVSLLVSSIGYLLGDVRYAACLAQGGACLLLWWHSRDRLGRTSAAMLLAIPGLPFVLSYGWTEPIVLGLLAVTVVALARGWRAAPYLLGALLVSKQYFLFTSPLLVLLLPVARQRGGARWFFLKAVASGTFLTAPAILWSPSAFWDSVVAFQFRQPFRPDSISVLVSLVNATGWPPEWTYGIVPLLASTLTAFALAAWAPRTPASFAVCVAATLAVMFLTSKQAFPNYYFLTLGALLVAVAAWPSKWMPSASDEASEQGAQPALQTEDSSPSL